VDGDTITFSPSLSGPIILQNALPPIMANDVSIIGPVTIQYSGPPGAFTLNCAATYRNVRIENVVFDSWVGIEVGCDSFTMIGRKIYPIAIVRTYLICTSPLLSIQTKGSSLNNFISFGPAVLLKGNSAVIGVGSMLGFSNNFTKPFTGVQILST